MHGLFIDDHSYSLFSYLIRYTLSRRPLTIAHRSEIVDSSRVCTQILGRCANMSFGMRRASTLAFWGRPWALGTILGKRSKKKAR